MYVYAAGARRDARCAALEADRAESRRLGAAAATVPDQFACTVCCKNFADYANMCRHRRLAHGCGVRGVQDADASSSEGDDAAAAAGGTPAASAAASVDAQQAYFAGVSKNIAANLNHHVEGKAEHLSRAGSHIRWRQGATAAAAAEPPSPGQIRLEEFNFPRGFKMRASAEPCRVAAASPAPATDGSAAAGGDVMKNGSAAEAADEQRAKELVLINVPDVRQCAVCRCFHAFQ